MKLNGLSDLNAYDLILIDGKSYYVMLLTCEDLRIHYRTGRNIHISGTGRDRVSKYRTGAQTNIGDIEISVWQDLMRKVIARLGETELLEQLQHWVKEHCAWLRTENAVEHGALELHAARIFDDPLWGDYVDFNKQHRPEVLGKADLVWMKCKYCGHARQTTKENFERRLSLNGGEEFCHNCGRKTFLDLVDSQKEGDY